MTATIILSYQPKTENDQVGLVCYQFEKFNYVFRITKGKKDTYILFRITEKRELSNPCK
ncbi:hypothetical protein [uncultured Bacteroides sp.]|uniref:beta-xylosidase family glycoside hydrolase n=1 Tax=uncultured Bacteroides sp. TaxID=162156 RepID=UPI0037491E8E